MRKAADSWLKLVKSAQRRGAVCAMFCATALCFQANAETVRAWQGTLSIPTYKLGPSDPNPPFPLISAHDVYPYTMLDNLTSNRTPENYQALYLENQYLRIIILPQLGGHVYSIYDKIHRREVLYRNHVIKYGLVSPRGAWVAGGMEFSFPFAHTMDTVSPVESTIRRNPDGSSSAVVGAIDWVSNMYWEIALTLRPDTARLEEAVTLFNATPQPHLYLFWTNTAVKASNDLQYIYPMREVIGDDPFAPVRNWPEWDGIDHGWYKNVAGSMAIFGRDVHRDFFGVYYHQSDYGVVHLADFRQDPGKKIWTWGTARSGRIWDKLLSDHDGPYNEIQSGRFYTQGYREFMRPRRVERWTEYWYPISGLKDGFVDATRQVTLNVDYQPVNSDGGKVTVRLSPVTEIRDAILRLELGATVLKEVRGIDLRPLHTVAYTFPVQQVEAAKRDLEIEVLSSSGQQLLHWSAAASLDGNPDFVARAGKALQKEIPDSPQTPTQALYLRGVYLEKSGDQTAALKVYEQVLQRDPQYIPALLQEAWYHYRGADFADAERLIVQAEKRDQTNPEVQYAAGVIYRAEGRLNAAKDAFWTVIHYGGMQAPAFAELGEIAIRQGNDLEAQELLKRAVSVNPDDAFALADLSVAERLDGKLQDAIEAAQRAWRKMPLLPYVVAELGEDKRCIAKGGSDEEHAGTNWNGIVSSDPQNALAVAAWYHSLGAWHSADEILSSTKDDPSASPIRPMIDYYLASDARQEGDRQKARQYMQAAAQARTVAVFPNRLEDVAVLSEQLQSNPADLQAKYEMGNFLFAHGRYDEAANLWRQARDAGFVNSVLVRNLGVYAWRVQHNLSKAADDYAEAISMSPNQYRLYSDLDEIYEMNGNTVARTKLFQEAPEKVLDHDTVQARYAIYLIEQRRYEAALTMLAGHEFTPWEGGIAIHNLFVFANMRMGQQKLADHKPAEAEKYFREAMQYPENLGTGRPPNPIQAQQLYWLGNALETESRSAEAETAWRSAASEAKDGTGACQVFSDLALEKLDKKDVAQALLEQCIESAEQPDATATELFDGGIAERYAGHLSRACEDFSRALAADPLDWEARIALEAAQ